MKTLVPLFLLAFISTVRAQPAPTYVPLTLNEQEIATITNLLGDTPSRYANPIFKILGDAENRAKAAQQKEPSK